MEPIVSNVPGSLPWHVWHERHPALFAKLKEAHPFPPEINTALDGLLAETLAGGAWLDAPFLAAEGRFYRRLLDAIGYFAPGPWEGFDLFAIMKDADLASAPLDDLPALTTAQHLVAALWGNQADLGFQLGAAIGRAAHLIVDETDAALSVLAGARRVGLVADNAGKELLADLGLIDHLLSVGGVHEVTLHLKPHPYYVSDATTADLVKCLRALAGAGGRAADIANRLHSAAAEGRFVIAADPFFCAPLPFHDAPPGLFGPADVLIFKGDLNYRRLVGDVHRPATTPFASTLPPFDGVPVVALRTVKSEVLVGAHTVTPDLDLDGRYGSIQVRG